MKKTNITDVHSLSHLRLVFVTGTLVLVLLFCVPVTTSAKSDALTNYSPVTKNDLRNIQIANPYTTNRTHRKSNVWLTITNWGYIGNDSPNDDSALDDPEYPGTWAPQCEFPGGSGTQYLFMGALWIGALVQEEGFEFPRVSEGSEGWTNPLIHEFYPGEGAEHGIVERSNRPNEWNRIGEYVSSPDAISEQDFLCDYADTLTDPSYVRTDPIDGPHFPLGLKVNHRSYSWTYNYAQDFILIDYEIENIASNYLKNLYVGLYIDSDVGNIGEGATWHQDDICGFQEYYYFTRSDGQPDSARINIAYIADNDGRPESVASGSDFTCPAVSGTRVVRAPNPRLQTTFNWWISHGTPASDFGPSWEEDGSGGWTVTYGTPMGDERKYFVMSNREFDYDQIRVDDPQWVAAHPQHLRYYDGRGNLIDTTKTWKIADAANAQDLANGFDTRYLISWGPLGIYDHTDEAGNDIYRLNPGEKFNMSLAYVLGDNFHDRGKPQSDNTDIDFTKFDFADLKYNAAWAAWVYDNPMRDTPCFDWGNDHDSDVIDDDGSQGDGQYDTGDGWYGEDTGRDGLFAILPPGIDSVEVWYFGTFMGWYSGPDADGSELDGVLQEPEEDNWYLPNNEYIFDGLFETSKFGLLDLGYMRGNHILDAGDGIPDFQGPQPPPVPDLGGSLPTAANGVISTEDAVVLNWTKYPSENPAYLDNFSHTQDFEGYRIYYSNSGLENDFSLVKEYDKVDFAYFSANDSMVTYPDPRTDAPADTVINSVTFTRKPVGNNIGFAEIANSDSSYSFVFNDVHPLFPRWYSVTAFDYGDPQSGTEPLETARTANAQYVAPSGNPQNKVIVVPNPYRAYEDYTQSYSGGLRWENQDDGTPEYYPNTDRRLEFINLPDQCLIRIFTLAGDLVAVIPHNIAGDDNFGWASEYSESWDLNSRNNQQVTSGLYIFSVENYIPGKKGQIQTGKFVIIR